MNLFLSEEELARRIKHNEELYDIPKVIEDGELYEDVLILKLKAFVDVTKTDSGLLEPSFKVGSTVDGRPDPKFNDYPYAPIGVVMKAGDGKHAQKYAPKDLVWLDFRALRLQGYEFLLDMDTPVSKPEGYVRVPTSIVTFVEKKAPQEEPKKTVNETYAS